MQGELSQEDQYVITTVGWSSSREALMYRQADQSCGQDRNDYAKSMTPGLSNAPVEDGYT